MLTDTSNDMAQGQEFVGHPKPLFLWRIRNTGPCILPVRDCIRTHFAQFCRHAMGGH